MQDHDLRCFNVFVMSRTFSTFYNWFENVRMILGNTTVFSDAFQTLYNYKYKEYHSAKAWFNKAIYIL